MNHLITLAACLTTTALLHAQNPIFVTLNGKGDGTSWANACNLETAVGTQHAALLPGTEIWVQRGTHEPSTMLIIPDSVKVYGGFSGTETNLSQRDFVANQTIVDAQQKFGSVFRLGVAAELNGLTIQNGNAQGNPHHNGGGVWADDNAVVANCNIVNNTALMDGHGVYAKGNLTLVGSVVKNSTVEDDGMIFGNCVTIDPASAQISMLANSCNTAVPGWGTSLGTVSFRSPTIRKISGNSVYQEWSDVVMATGCNKTSFNSASIGFSADCRSNSNRSTLGDLFSWCAVVRYGHVLCPAPWRVPTVGDYGNLDRALGGYGNGTGPGAKSSNAFGNYYTNTTILSRIINTWGGLYGAVCDYVGVLYTYQTKQGAYWAQSAYNSGRGSYSNFQSDGIIRPQGHASKGNGFMLRCVR